MFGEKKEKKRMNIYLALIYQRQRHSLVSGSLQQRFSSRGDFAPRGDIWQCLGTFFIVTGVGC